MAAIEAASKAENLLSITVVSPTNTEISRSAETAYDLGYEPSESLSRVFIIRNTGGNAISIVSITSDDSSAVSVDKPLLQAVKLASQEELSFSLSFNPSNAVSATINIITDAPDSPSFSFKVYSTGVVLPFSHAHATSYRLSANGFSFGYSDGSATRQIIIKNEGSSDITLNQPGSTVSPSTEYSIVSFSAPTVAAGQTVALTLRYTPSSSTAWSVATCTLVDTYGRSYAIRLFGSGYPQPPDTGVTPALWLSADRIGESDTIILDGTRKVSTWKDASGNGLSADAFNYNGDILRPSYNSTGINGNPTITFSGTSLRDHLRVYPQNGAILTTGTGTTSFIVFKTSASVVNTRYIIQAQNSGGTEVFPRFSYAAWYFDPSDGFYASSTGGDPRVQYRFELAGYSGHRRHPLDSPTNQVETNATYMVNMKYNLAVTTPNPNIFLRINEDDTDTPIGYLHSVSTTATSGLVGAYGFPIGNGLGAIDPTAGSRANDYANSLSANNALFFNRITPSSFTYNSSLYYLHIGNSSNSTATFQGDIAEIILFAEPLSEDNTRLVNRYLMNKYGIAY